MSGGSRRIARGKAKKALLEQQMAALELQEAEEEAAQQNSKMDAKKNKPKTVARAKTIPNTSDYQFKSDKVLQLFTDCFYETFEDMELLTQQIQAVKSNLYDRDYTTAFGTDSNRAAYVVRWSPARALAYSSLFVYLEPLRLLLSEFKNPEDVNVLSIGGGAGSELVALASIFCKSREAFTSSEKKLNLQLVDVADWSKEVAVMDEFIQKNWLFTDHVTDTELFNASFQKADVLQLPNPETVYPKLNLITLLFTTNELFKENKTLSIAFLNNLNKYCSKGCLLLITESAGSYSEIQIGSKSFPIQFLVDLILCGKPEEQNGNWQIVDQNDSIWYRLENELDYDLKLENMRCFYRLYRRV